MIHTKRLNIRLASDHEMRILISEEKDDELKKAYEEMLTLSMEQDTVKRVEAEIETDNIASQRVLEKVGFVPTGKNGEEGPRF